MSPLTDEIASTFAQAALGHVGREYPNVIQHVLTGPEDAHTPAELHPIFYGSYDWHSCVHAHWMMARLLRERPDLPEAEFIAAWFDQGFTPAKVAREAHYFEPLPRRGYERPYGWAWLLKLAAELTLHERPWGMRLLPLTAAIVARLKAFLPKADYPVRAGVHSNTAFALSLAADYGAAAEDSDLMLRIRDKALTWYEDDADPSAIEGQSVAVIGYGNQGRSWALNLRDAGLKPSICVRADASREQAQRDGFETLEPTAASDADIVVVLIPDDMIPTLELTRPATTSFRAPWSRPT